MRTVKITTLLFLVLCPAVCLGQVEESGSVYAWGQNDYAQCDVPEPNTGFIAIAAGEVHSLGLKADGSIVTWGWNGHGQLDVPPPNTGFIAIASGGYHSLALKSDGSIVGWGNNSSGISTPPAGNDFVAIAGGGYHSLAIKSDGSLVGWGGNWDGQISVPGGYDFVAISAGHLHSLALKSDGSLVGWGWNNVGQTNVPAGNDFVSIAAGFYHGLALRSDGSLVGWGLNDRGQLNVPAGNDYVAIAGRWYHNLALKSDGSIVAWGGVSAQGQLNVPEPNAGFIAVAVGANHSLAIKETPSGAFAYQGILVDESIPMDGFYDFEFNIYDGPFEVNQLAETVIVDDLDVIDGHYTAELDFGRGVFTGQPRWVAVHARPGELNDPNVYTILTPRQEVTPVPYALYAERAGTDNDWMVSGNDMYSIPSGSVGIGTTTPASTLDVAGDIHASGPIASGNSITIDGINDKITASSGKIDFDDEDLVTTGSVGIGTKSPGAELDVDGQIKIRGGLPGNGKVLTSDASGLASWQTLAGGDITAVSAGTGLSGGGTTGSVTLAVQVPLILSAPVARPEGVISVLNTGTGDGVNGNAVTGAGVTGDHLSTGNFGKLGTSEGGVLGVHNATGNWGELGASLAGVWGRGSPYAGQFDGNVRINGDLAVDGTLFKAGGSFKIDHPLDPENKYLSHSFVESPDMMNVYNGNVVLDENGGALIKLPEYFEALNVDFRYQLTCIGGFAPVYISEEISNNHFKIAGGESGMKVSWQVTGIRQDAYAKTNRIVVEEDKSAGERGYYLHPTAYGLPEDKGIAHHQNQQTGPVTQVARKAGEL